MNARSFLTLILIVIVSGVGAQTAQAECLAVGDPADHIYDCTGVENNALVVPAGNGEVRIHGTMLGQILGTSGELRVTVAPPDGRLSSRIFVNQGGAVILTGDQTSSSYGIYLEDGERIISRGNITSRYGSLVLVWPGVGSSVGSASSTIDSIGNIITTESGSSGIHMGAQNGAISSVGNIQTIGTGISFGLPPQGRGTVVSTGEIRTRYIGILVGGQGSSIVNVGDVVVDAGIGLAISDGSINGAGRVNAYWQWPDMRGSGTISNTGNVTSGNGGLVIMGSGTIVSTGDIVSTRPVGASYDVDLPAILIRGAGSVHSVGNVSGDYGGIRIGSGSIVSVGDISSRNTLRPVIEIAGVGSVHSTGNVDGTIRIGEGSIVSIGNITDRGLGFWDGAAILIDSCWSEGDFCSVESRGNVTTQRDGIFVQGDGSIVSVGAVSAGGYGIRLNGSGTINVTGSVTITGSRYANVPAISGDFSDGREQQIVYIDALVDGPQAVRLGTGDDSLTISGNSVIRSSFEMMPGIRSLVDMGPGDDVVTIGSGALVSGLIDGGDGEETMGDRLIVGSAGYCANFPEDVVLVDAQRAMLGQLVISDGVATIVSEGRVYTVGYFEHVESGLWLRECADQFPGPVFRDGRVNAYDAAAPVAYYCNVADGVNLWTIDAQSTGVFELSVPGDLMRAALETAVRLGTHQLIAEGQFGSTVYALSSNEYQINHLMPDGTLYESIFAPNTCVAHPS